MFVLMVPLDLLSRPGHIATSSELTHPIEHQAQESL
ncbi:MAG: hypothetical protein ACI97A_000954 [Planctomycetota bacterium]|jgi:hypothetical protein